MKKKLTKKEQIWNNGKRIYEWFCAMFEISAVPTPHTKTLELFAVLKKKNQYQLLIREMMKEFISNLNDTEVFVEKGKLYQNAVYREKL
ncbi:MAG: hypothetical protein U1E54_03360 [Candidatus Levybacteria bacterium]|nr:hypothetical protein [Candidatus Levybacteria bacterium]